MTHASDARCWAGQLDELVTRIAPRFNRIEPRRRARAYLRDAMGWRRRDGTIAAGSNRRSAPCHSRTT